MPGGDRWTQDEDAFIRSGMEEGLTNAEIHRTGKEAGVLHRRSIFGVSKRRTALAAVEGLESVEPRPEDNQSRIARALSGEFEPTIKFGDWQQPKPVHWKDWFGQWQTVLDYHRQVDPHQEILTVDLRSRSEPVAVAFGADFHLGGGFTSHGAILETMEFILGTDGIYLALVGDIIEGFIPGEGKGAASSEQMAGSLTGQLSALKSLVNELCEKDKLLCLSWGDHDAKWFEKMVGLNVVKREFHDRVPYFTGRGLMRLLVGQQEYFVQVNHAARGSSMWNDNQSERKMHASFFPADVNVSGHRHRPAFQMMHHYEQLREAGLNLGGKTWLVKTGTFKTGSDPYTIRSWSKGIMGVPTAVFQTAVHDVDVMESPEKAEALRRGLR